MIIEAIITLFVKLVCSILGFINFPDMPTAIVNVFDKFFEMIENALNVFGWFLDFDFLAVILPIVVIVANMERLYRFVMWIIRKLPFGIE